MERENGGDNLFCWLKKIHSKLIVSEAELFYQQLNVFCIQRSNDYYSLINATFSSCSFVMSWDGKGHYEVLYVFIPSLLLLLLVVAYNGIIDLASFWISLRHYLQSTPSQSNKSNFVSFHCMNEWTVLCQIRLCEDLTRKPTNYSLNSLWFCKSNWD